MCFTKLIDGTIMKQDLEPRIAQEDIIVIKIMKKEGDDYFSPFYGRAWMKNVMTPEVPLVPKEKDESYFIIDEGYHAFTYITTYRMNILQWGHPNMHHVAMVIPKGAKYFVNEKDHEIVASQMMFVNEHVNDLLKADYVNGERAWRAQLDQ